MLMVVLGASMRLSNAKSSMVHENNPDAACMDEIEDGQKERCTGKNRSRITPATYVP